MSSSQAVCIKDCKLCIVAGKGRRPKGLPQNTPALRDDWLLAAAVGVKLPLIQPEHLILP